MRNAFFHGTTLDDILRDALEAIQKDGEHVKATKGSNTEIRGVMFDLSNPCARLSRTESRGKLFSCMGELCWYLSGTNSTDFVAHYISYYQSADENGKIYGGYGPRLFEAWKGTQQFENLISRLRRNPGSRKGVLQLFDSADLTEDHKDVPCTCTLQFFVRGGQLHLIVYMRSNDVIRGFPHDVFCFTMLQEIVARTLSVGLGVYTHCVGSLHLYDRDQANARSFLQEGWQSTKSAMPPMPTGDPWPAIRKLLIAEAEVRTTGAYDVEKVRDLGPYWGDLARLLQIFEYKRRENKEGLESVRSQMSSRVYDTYIERILSEFEQN